MSPDGLKVKLFRGESCLSRVAPGLPRRRLRAGSYWESSNESREQCVRALVYFLWVREGMRSLFVKQFPARAPDTASLSHAHPLVNFPVS